MTITLLEAKLLNAIVHDEHQPINGATPDEFCDLGDVWTNTEWWAKAVSVTEPQIKGVLGSLTSKGLVRGQDNETPDAITWVTEEGYTAWVNEAKVS